ncbi:MAG: hypothetical protein MJ158_02270 [Alphaproteobacteria bacterium]|nr:hypothetical protein [Alphaproteobacteria bacterium]
MKKIILSIITCTVLCGCMTTQDYVLGTNPSQLSIRNYQSRQFDTTDKSMVLRAVLSTMQDLGFIIERADEKLGTISGTSFSNSSVLSVSVRVVSDHIVVRANAQVHQRAITNPITYQNFFDSLAQSLFLEAHEVE